MEAITPKVFARFSPGFLPWDQQRRLIITPKALANTFGVIGSIGAKVPSVVAALQHWAEFRERLRRNTSEKQRTEHAAKDSIGNWNSPISKKGS
jgi:hypothetical protein